ncbi:MAG: hypothetical protein FJ265_00895 [Planctomycetes bacterium]|nr:hypothetical protein [Planctomycetota bacterium]
MAESPSSFPQVDLQFERQTGSGREVVRLPFVVTVLADLAGAAALQPLGERGVLAIAGPTCGGALAQVRPALVLEVEDLLGGTDGGFRVELGFGSLEDFGPEAVARRVPALGALLARRGEFLPDVNRAPAADLLGDVLAATDRQRGAAPGDARAEVDRAISRQLDAVLHDPAFQALEASWRGLRQLALAAGGSGRVLVRVLPVRRGELLADVRSGPAATQRALWQLVRPDRHGATSLFVLDFAFGRGAEDVELLRGLADLAVAAGAPLVAGAAPELCGVPGFPELGAMRRFDAVFDKERPENARWTTFRGEDRSRWTALVLPRWCARPPHRPGDAADGAFAHAEVVLGAADRPWGNGAWSVAASIARAVARTGWLGDGDLRAAGGGGTDGDLEVELDAERGSQLQRHGLLALLPPGAAAAGLRASTVHRPKQFTDEAATASAFLSAQLAQQIALSRLGHHLAAMRAAGAGGSAAEWQQRFSQWLDRYVGDDGAPAAARAGRPLREAYVEVEPDPRAPGRLRVVLGICTGAEPHPDGFAQLVFEV